MRAINQNISLILLLVFVTIANGADLRFYNGSLDDYEVISFDEPLALLNSSYYQSDKSTVVYAFGYIETANDSSVQSIIGPYLGKVNILLLNWEKEAGGLIGVSYVLTAVSNAKEIGEQFGKALVKLNAAGLNFTTLHLIGFSLGAQLMASAGIEVQKSNLTVERITGLDPAGPLYQGQIVTPQLNSTCAKFVDAYHTNPGVFGDSDAVGDIDVWFNCGSSTQPACAENLVELVTISTVCSHNIVWSYYNDILLNATAFQARAASSCDAWKAGNGTNETIYLGDKINTTARGNFYLRTNEKSFYGLGEEGSQPSNSSSTSLKISLL